MTSRKKVNWEGFFKLTFECQLWFAVLLALAVIVTGGRSPSSIMKSASDAARAQERRIHNENVRIATQHHLSKE